MRQASFGNFQVGMVPNPSVEDKGGFEFASGMDIFSEPGVMKANWTTEDVSYGTGAAPDGPITHMVECLDANGLPMAFLAAGTKLLYSAAGMNPLYKRFELFLTNSEGPITGLAVWNGYVVYASGTTVGRAPIADPGSKDDDYITTLPDAEYHPMVSQGGTLKIAAGRYVSTLNESFTLSAQALKVPSEYQIKCMAEYMGRIFLGTIASGGSEPLSTAAIFEWRGFVLASGSALPDAAYPLNARGVHALVTDGDHLYAFPGFDGSIWAYTGATFAKVKDTFTRGLSIPEGSVERLRLEPGAVTAYGGSVFYGGKPTTAPGIYQLKQNALIQAIVPVSVLPGGDSQENITLVKHALIGNLYVGTTYSGSTNHLTVLSTNRDNNTFVRTLWHRVGTDRLKRFAGIMLNLKTLAANTAVTVAYRTARDGAFTNMPHTITATNQDRPVMFAVRPRTREIQFRFTYTTNGSSTPELLSYDILFEPLNAMR